MLEELKAKAGEKLTKSILDSIYNHLSEPKLEPEAGEVKLIDHDDSCLYFGLFEIDADTGLKNNEPTIICTVEVFSDINGGR